MKEGYYKGLYLIAALYDFILGFAFLFFYKQIYQMTGMNLPDNPAYLSMCAVFVMLLAVAFFLIYRDPKSGRKLIIYSILYKFAYICVVVYYYALGKIQNLMYVDIPFLILVVTDLIFALLFIESLRYAKK